MASSAKKQFFHEDLLEENSRVQESACLLKTQKEKKNTLLFGEVRETNGFDDREISYFFEESTNFRKISVEIQRKHLRHLHH